jgi:hypothetical protein
MATGMLGRSRKRRAGKAHAADVPAQPAAAQQPASRRQPGHGVLVLGVAQPATSLATRLPTVSRWPVRVVRSCTRWGLLPARAADAG